MVINNLLLSHVMPMEKSFDDPVEIFSSWYGEMLNAGGVREPTAMILATCDTEKRPSARIVLLKKHSQQGFEFYTNLGSRKGREIAENPRVALVFDWQVIHKQVRVEGMAELMDSAMSDAYYASRSRESQLSGLCSKQSAVLHDREELLQEIELASQKFAGREIPRPEYWGGILVVPHTIEFWSEGAHRLHHRKRYSKNSLGQWECVELYP